MQLEFPILATYSAQNDILSRKGKVCTVYS